MALGFDRLIAPTVTLEKIGISLEGLGELRMIRVGTNLQGADFISMQALGAFDVITHVALVGQLRNELRGLWTVATKRLFSHGQSPLKDLSGIVVVLAVRCKGPEESKERHELPILRSIVRFNERDRSSRHRFGKFVIPLRPLEPAK